MGLGWGAKTALHVVVLSQLGEDAPNPSIDSGRQLWAASGEKRLTGGILEVLSLRSSSICYQFIVYIYICVCVCYMYMQRLHVYTVIVYIYTHTPNCNQSHPTPKILGIARLASLACVAATGLSLKHSTAELPSPTPSTQNLQGQLKFKPQGAKLKSNKESKSLKNNTKHKEWNWDCLSNFYAKGQKKHFKILQKDSHLFHFFYKCLHPFSCEVKSTFIVLSPFL